MGDQGIMKETLMNQMMHLIQTRRQKLTKETTAQLCAIILLNGKTRGQFAMTLDELATRLDLPSDEVHAAIRDAFDRNLVHRVEASVVLQAAGIYFAKEVLGLPR